MELGNEFDLKDIEQTTRDYLSKLGLRELIDESSIIFCKSSFER